MSLFFVGIGLFALGALLNAVGWRWHTNSIKTAGIDDGFIKGLLRTVTTWFETLTAPNHTNGQRLAAFGAILSAIGIVLARGDRPRYEALGAGCTVAAALCAARMGLLRNHANPLGLATIAWVRAACVSHASSERPWANKVEDSPFPLDWPGRERGVGYSHAV
jgi:hypothetical protein